MKKVFFITLAIILPIITFDIFSPKIKDARTLHQLDMAMSFTSAAATIRFDAFTNITNTGTDDEFAVWSTSAGNIRNITFSNLENDIDHGNLQGLTDDDHTQYMKESVYDPNIDGIIDISSATNLTAGTGITLSGDTVLVQDIYVLTAGDTMTGDLVMSAANIDLGTYSVGGGQLLSGASTVLYFPGTRSMFFGLDVGNINATGTDNIGVGKFTLRNLNSGGHDNVAVGSGALDLVTGGDNNTGIGTGSCAALTTGNDNVCLGDGSLAVLQTGSYNVAVGTSAMGVGAGTAIDSNVAVGDNSLQIVNSNGNVGVGDSAGKAWTTGGNNTAIGYLAGSGGTATIAKAVTIGYNAQSTASNAMILGATGATDNVDVVIGATAPISSSRFTINGEEDQIQALIQGHSTQTNDLMQMENSTGSDVFRVTNTGNFVVTGSSVTFAGFDCSGNSNGGALTVDANGDLSCTDDDSGAGGGGTTIDVQDSGSAIVSTSTVSFNGPLVATNSGGDAQVTISDGSIDISQYTNLTAGTGITLSGDTVLVTDNYLVNNANDTTTGVLTADGNVLRTMATCTVCSSTADIGHENSCDQMADGTADEVQIQACIDTIAASATVGATQGGANGKGLVWLSQGTFNIANTINIKPGMKIEGGAFPSGVVLKSSGADPIMAYNGGASPDPAAGFHMENLWFDGASSADVGFDSKTGTVALWDVWIEDSLFYSFTGSATTAAVQIDDPFGFVMQNSQIEDSAGWGLIIAKGASKTNGAKLYGNKIIQNDSGGVWLKDVDGTAVIGNEIQCDSGACIAIKVTQETTSGNGNIIQGNTIWGGVDGINIGSGATSNMVMGNITSGNSSVDFTDNGTNTVSWGNRGDDGPMNTNSLTGTVHFDGLVEVNEDGDSTGNFIVNTNTYDDFVAVDAANDRFIVGQFTGGTGDAMVIQADAQGTFTLDLINDSYYEVDADECAFNLASDKDAGLCFGSGYEFRDLNAAVFTRLNLSGDLDTAGALQLASLTDASASCIAIDSDRPYADKDCDSTKDAGEEYLDQVGSGSPGGSDTQIQYNNSSSFGGISTFTYDGTDLTLSAEMIVTGTMDVSGGDLEIPNGTGTTLEETGEIYFDTTADELKLYNGSSSVTFASTQFKSLTIVNPPTSTVSYMLFRSPYDITVTRYDGIVDPADSGDSINIAIQECNTTGDSCTDIDAADLTVGNTGASDTSVSSGGITGGNWVNLQTGTLSGTVGTVTVTFQYTVDGQ